LSKIKSPKFFCENCGAEVPREEKRCPKCGRYFASVRCPACGFTGEEALFKGGCPVCGYSSEGASSKSGQGDFPEKARPTGALPVWVYLLTAAVFTAVAAALFLVIFK